MIFFIGIFLQAHEEAPILLRESRLIERLPRHNTQVIYLDTDWPKINHRSRKNPISGVRPENLAYVIRFTTCMRLNRAFTSSSRPAC